jgi:Cof subfamily protein (haloacid dehalogenase superfamily)
MIEEVVCMVDKRLKLVATDLDGTFLNRFRGVNEARFNQLLARMATADAHFVIASGQDELRIDDLFKSFVGRVDLVASNGAVIRTAGGEILHVASIDHKELKHAMDVVQSLPIFPKYGAVFSARQGVYMLRDQARVNRLHTQLVKRLYKGKLSVIDDIDEINEDIVKFTIGFKEEETYQFIDQARQVLGDRAHVTTSGYGSVDIVSPTVNKAAGLRYLADYYGVELGEDLAAFGDGLNDLEMLEAAAKPFVMPNSDKNLLDGRFPVALADNNHDGVLATAETLF